MAKPPSTTRRSLPLQAILTLLFVAIIVVTAGGLVLYSHERLSRIAKVEARENFDRISATIARGIGGAIGSAQIFLETAALSLDTDMPPEQLAPLFARLLREVERINPAVTGLTFGRPDGRFYAVFDLSRGIPEEVAAIAKDKAAFAVRIGLQTGPGAGEGADEHWQVLDGDLKTIGTTPITTTDYDPRLRPWYQDAMRLGGLVLTSPYQFRPLPVMGVTLAQRLDDSPGDVISIDVELDDLDRQLAELRESPEMELFVFDDRGNLIAHPDAARLRMEIEPDAPEAMTPIALLDDPEIAALYASYRADSGSGDRVVTIAGRPYLTRFQTVKGPVRGLTTAMAAPYDLILGPADRLQTRLLLVGLAAILVGAVIVMLVSGRVTRPLRDLQADVARIMKFDFEEPPLRRSSIAEIVELGGAVTAMRAALRQFSRYVPGQLVHNILAHRVQPELGGKRQTLTLLFSDVVGFTTLAENLDPETLTQVASRYFSEVGAALVESGGTIDKYIGDAVMAFWNAPAPQPDHVRLACLGALEAAERVRKLNEAFQAEGSPVMPTRFGLHTGEVVVGTIGSVDRINYTALGHVVNLASRIEGLNKRYGTTILVSDAVRQGAGGDFLFRFVDSVVPVGATEPIALYELMGLAEKLPDTGQRVALWNEACSRYYARDWDAVLARLDQMQERWPEDRLAQLYRDRADRHRREPPPADWTGIERAKTK
ncbi:adenylate/guanylate cyclase domain-containing protein [Hypericibacter terrae]|uniref:adenylate/guanylate cyclase domain-containing protein n=1 Tax=Hypericibacter terrae TaxID=2602015 RepID=UPI0012462E35|nr:adenylate/guanylate cyclase domain-containing protein [Hypericibacter terrae]